ncbi:DinB family protein [Autumnicola edwardsiae]|uniref:DinB family protein n=1 Tax=Autumnicola edwardsiae TaxID=3075594 RepID=A0ABU3CUR8_9FLAO|nr:DinB family protein [Zunongwangia sp. F297]MDT0650106.1 DinB family protein [Zunongwangia sp. F297]
MDIQDLLLPQLRQEAALTIKFFNRIPEEKLDWRPHSKSMSFKELANHMAEIPSWITATMEMSEMDMESYATPDFNTVPEIIKAFKINLSQAENSLKKDDEEYQKDWRMLKNGNKILEMPRLDVLRMMVLSQLPHHRAQMGVYFRLLDIDVPSTYGPSADER